MPTQCPECGCRLPDAGRCEQHFHALLLLEYEVVASVGATLGGRGEIAHFYAVSSYILQHPEGMNYTSGALENLRRLVGDHLSGQVTLGQQRHRVHHGNDGKGPVTRRPGDLIPRWPVVAWPMTIADVLAGGVEGYCERVASWAASVVGTLNAAGI